MSVKCRLCVLDEMPMPPEVKPSTLYATGYIESALVPEQLTIGICQSHKDLMSTGYMHCLKLGLKALAEAVRGHVSASDPGQPTAFVDVNVKSKAVN